MRATSLTLKHQPLFFSFREVAKYHENKENYTFSIVLFDYLSLWIGTNSPHINHIFYVKKYGEVQRESPRD